MSGPAPTVLPHPAAIQREVGVVVAALTALTWLWVLRAGKSVNWDVVNHHLYLPFSLVTGRFQTDLFAAGPQSYQNPLGYLPFYALVRTGAPDWLVGMALTLVHAGAAGAIYGIAIQIWGTAPATRFWRVMAIAVAWVAPIFLIVVGTSSTDPLTGTLVLCSLWAGLQSSKAGSLRFMLSAGCLLGLAFAIKPSNAVFVLSITGLVALRAVTGQVGHRQLLAFAGAGLASGLVFMGAWSAWLWWVFGNPLFPLFNQYFGSPYAPIEPMVAARFLPHGPEDYALRLWDLISRKRSVSTEAFTPDIRPVALACVLMMVVVKFSWRQPGRWMQRQTWMRADVQTALFVVVSYLLWLKTSGNSRYAVPLFMICGLLLVRACETALPRRVARVALGVLLGMQLLYYGLEGEHRFGPAPWTGGPYLDAHVPAKLKNEPFLHLSVGVLSSASVAPYLNHGGALVNVNGQMSLPVDGPLGSALQQRLQAWQGRTRFLVHGPVAGTPRGLERTRQKMDGLVYRLGLQIDWADCETIWFASEKVRTSTPSLAQALMQDQHLPLWSCGAMPLAVPDPAYAQQAAVTDRLFMALQAQCPQALSPAPFVSEYLGHGLWQRLYINSDARVTASFKDGVTITQGFSGRHHRLGSIDDVLAQRQAPCHLFMPS